MIRKAINIIGFVFLTLNVSGQNIDKSIYRYYDFNIVVDFNELLFTPDSKFMLRNVGYYDDKGTNSRQKLAPNKLYKINYRYDSDTGMFDIKRIPTDTLITTLTDNDMDSLFALTTDLFDLSGIKNETHHKISPPPIIYDGAVVEVIFDLGYKGDYYSVEIKVPDENFAFLRLNNFLEVLISDAQ